MSFTLPTFNLNVNIWRHQGVSPPVGAPDVTAMGNLAAGRRIVSSEWTMGDPLVDAFYFHHEDQLLLPKLTDIRGVNSVTGTDAVECPAGSGRFYEVRWVYDAGKGFTNEHRVALMSQVPPFVDPLP